MTVRDIDDRTYEMLVELAASSRRSLQQQVLVILEAEVMVHRRGLLDRAQGWRRRLGPRASGDVVADLRELRSR